MSRGFSASCFCSQQRKGRLHLERLAPSWLQSMMLDFIRIKPHSNHVRPCRLILFLIGRVRQKEFGSTLGAVNLNGHGYGGTDENPFGRFFCNHQRPLFETIAPSKPRWYHHDTFLAYLTGCTFWKSHKLESLNFLLSSIIKNVPLPCQSISPRRERA